MLLSNLILLYMYNYYKIIYNINVYNYIFFFFTNFAVKFELGDWLLHVSAGLFSLHNKCIKLYTIIIVYVESIDNVRSYILVML